MSSKRQPVVTRGVLQHHGTTLTGETPGLPRQGNKDQKSDSVAVGNRVEKDPGNSPVNARNVSSQYKNPEKREKKQGCCSERRHQKGPSPRDGGRGRACSVNTPPQQTRDLSSPRTHAALHFLISRTQMHLFALDERHSAPNTRLRPRMDRAKNGTVISEQKVRKPGGAPLRLRRLQRVPHTFAGAGASPGLPQDRWRPKPSSGLSLWRA